MNTKKLQKIMSNVKNMVDKTKKCITKKCKKEGDAVARDAKISAKEIKKSCPEISACKKHFKCISKNPFNIRKNNAKEWLKNTDRRCPTKKECEKGMECAKKIVEKVTKNPSADLTKSSDDLIKCAKKECSDL